MKVNVGQLSGAVLFGHDKTGRPLFHNSTEEMFTMTASIRGAVYRALGLKGKEATEIATIPFNSLLELVAWMEKTCPDILDNDPDVNACYNELNLLIEKEVIKRLLAHTRDWTAPVVPTDSIETTATVTATI